MGWVVGSRGRSSWGVLGGCWGFWRDGWKKEKKRESGDFMNEKGKGRERKEGRVPLGGLISCLLSPPSRFLLYPPVLFQYVDAHIKFPLSIFNRFDALLFSH